MPYNYTDNAADSSLKTFFLVKFYFQSVRTVIEATNASPIWIRTSTPHGLTGGETVTITNVLGSTRTITGASNENPIKITTSGNHGFSSSDYIIIAGVGGNTAANGGRYITKVNETQFTLNSITGNGNYTSGGTAVKGNGAANGVHVITYVDTTRFSLNGSTGNGAYVSGGVVLYDSPLYWTTSDIPLYALGQLWTPQGMAVSNIDTSTGQSMGATIDIQNADYSLSGLVYNPLSVRNVLVDIYEAWMDPTASTASISGGLGVDVRQLMAGRIDNASLIRSGDTSTATFTLKSLVEPTSQVLPHRLLTHNCTVLFKGVACQYTGHDETCQRTMDDCQTKGNLAHYGGFPSLPSTTP